MGIISRGNPEDRKRSGTTVIAAGTKLVGDLTLTDSLHVDGSVDGKVDSDGEVSVGEGGQITGEIRAEIVMISGQFEGLIDAQRLEIVATGKVAGTVTVEQLVIESGASFNGTSKIREPEPPRQIGHDGGKKDRQESKDAEDSGDD
ncbi:MAG: polymer-forming cytoskeletal protein [Pseudomonadota bacterium]